MASKYIPPKETKSHKNYSGRRKPSKKVVGSLFIALVSLILVAAICLTVIYFAAPDVWDYIYTELHAAMGYGAGSEGGGSQGGGLAASEGSLQIHFIDVGQGDSILIQFPDGKNMLIDGGEARNANVAKINGCLDTLGVTTLDYVLLTHTDSDHCGSLDDAIAHVTNVRTIYLPKVESKESLLGLDADYLKLTTTVHNNVVAAAQAATYEKDGSRVSAEIVYTEGEIVIEPESKEYRLTMYCRDDAYYRAMSDNAHDLNDVSPICVLEFNNTKTVLTGDANNSTVDTSSEKYFLDKMAAQNVVDADFDADILKVGHHGGKDSSGADFLDFVDVEYAVVCVGDNIGNTPSNNSTGFYDLYLSKSLDEQNVNISGFAGNNKYDHPHRDVCSDGGRLEDYGVVEAYYTSLFGTITATVDKDGEISFTYENQMEVSGTTVSFGEAEAGGASFEQGLFYCVTCESNEKKYDLTSGKSAD